MSMWLSVLETILIPLAGLFAMVIMGVIVARTKILSEEGTGIVTHLLVSLLLPLMMFTNVVENFRPWSTEYHWWFLLPLSALAMTTFGYSLGRLAHRLLAPPNKPRRTVFAMMCGWQNAGYIAIPLVSALFAGATHDKMLVYLFLFILGISPTLWSLAPYGVMQASENGGHRLEWKKILTPPFIANVSAVTLCLIGVPQIFSSDVLSHILDPLKAVGNTAAPIIMVLLGAMLAQTKTSTYLGVRFAAGLIFIKLILLPAITLGLLLIVASHWEINRGIAAIIFLQTAVPPATTLVIIARRYGSADVVSLINQAIIWSYLAAVITLPLWLTLGQIKLNLFSS